jgi:DNA-binding response OmpR family regulator
VTTILVAADAQWVRDQVRAAFVSPGQEVVEVTRGQDVREVYADVEPDLVILDLQIGNMGGVAVALDLRNEESAGRLERAVILLLLDRKADEFIGRRADVDMTLVKPVDAGVLRRAARELLDGMRAADAGLVDRTRDGDAFDEDENADADDDVPVVDVS